MTIDNCIRWLRIFKARMENPLPNTEGKGDEKAYIKIQAKKAYANMKKHILSSRKFQDHPIIKELNTKNGKEPKR